MYSLPCKFLPVRWWWCLCLTRLYLSSDPSPSSRSPLLLNSLLTNMLLSVCLQKQKNLDRYFRLAQWVNALPVKKLLAVFLSSVNDRLFLQAGWKKRIMFCDEIWLWCTEALLKKKPKGRWIPQHIDLLCCFHVACAAWSIIFSGGGLSAHYCSRRSSMLGAIVRSSFEAVWGRQTFNFTVCIVFFSSLRDWTAL